MKTRRAASCVVAWTVIPVVGVMLSLVVARERFGGQGVAVIGALAALWIVGLWWRGASASRQPLRSEATLV